MSPQIETLPAWSRDDDLIATLRIILAVSALLIIYIDPAEPNRYVTLTYTTLVCYVPYSITLHALARRRSPLMPSVRTVSHWADVGWYTLLIAVSSGTSSVFFFGFYFPILVASFRWGFKSGARVTLVSAVHVEAETEIHISERLAIEAFQMVAEGLSNVRRHTDATRATVGLTCRNRHLTLRIENSGAEQWEPFTPRSLSERARALAGGSGSNGGRTMAVS